VDEAVFGGSCRHGDGRTASPSAVEADDLASIHPPGGRRSMPAFSAGVNDLGFRVHKSAGICENLRTGSPLQESA
jgi:hypothetical protein